jgi:hypothetical protein
VRWCSSSRSGTIRQSVRLASPICVKQAVSWEGVLRFVPLLHRAPDADRREPYRRESVRRAVNDACAAVLRRTPISASRSAVRLLRSCLGVAAAVGKHADFSRGRRGLDRRNLAIEPNGRAEHRVLRGPAAARPESRRRQVSSAPDGDGSYLTSRTDRVSSPCARVPPRRLSRGRPGEGEGKRDEGARTAQPHRCHGR